MDVSAVMHIFQAFAIYLYASIYQSVNQSIYLMLYIYVICYICIDILSVYMYVYDIYKCVCKIIHNKHATKVN